MATYHHRHSHTVTLTPTQRTALLAFLDDVWPGEPSDVMQVSFTRDQQNPSSIQAGMVGVLRVSDPAELAVGMTIVQIDE